MLKTLSAACVCALLCGCAESDGKWREECKKYFSENDRAFSECTARVQGELDPSTPLPGDENVTTDPGNVDRADLGENKKESSPRVLA